VSDERWLPVPGFEGLYDVSDLGRIRSWHGRMGLPRPHFLTPAFDRPGYLFVLLCKDGQRTRGRVHQVVAGVFHGPRPDGLVIRHLDGNSTNNAASNLTYGTASENAQDTLTHGHNPKRNKTHCPQGHPYDEANTRVKPNGHRDCRACARAHNLRTDARRKLERVA
jgi:HNH endonuclease/NUMOD4 motif